MTQDTTPQTCTTTTTIIDEEVEQEEQEDCTDAASSEKDSTPWHLFGTVCPKEEIGLPATQSHHITDLSQRISVSGEWECGLADIQYPHTWYNVREDDTWFYLNERIPVGFTPSTKIASGYYRSPDVMLDHVNKALKRMSTDKTRAKMSYSTITQKMTLHMSPGTDFSMPYQSAMGTILGFSSSLVTSPARDRDTRVYTHPRVGEETNRAYPPELGLTPSATVTLPPAKPKTAGLTFTTCLFCARNRDHIRDDTGRRVPFEYGRMTVTLHFRWRRTGLF